jgi:hypothetical protein
MITLATMVVFVTMVTMFTLGDTNYGTEPPPPPRCGLVARLG